MNCKLIPQVVVTRVVLMPEPTVHVEAEITNYGNRDILLEGCLNVVCILALSNADAEYVESALSLPDKKHWEDEKWYSNGTTEADSLTYAAKVPLGSNIVFEMPLKDTISSGSDLSEDDYSKLEDLYVFTYLQINTKTLADKYDIDEEMDAVSGWWRVGRILDDGDYAGSSADEFVVAVGGELPSNSLPSSSDDDDDDKNYIFDIQDFRDLEEVDCSNGGTPQ